MGFFMDRRQLMAAMGAAALTPSFAKAEHFASGFSFPPEWAPHQAIWMGWTDSVTNDPGRQELWLQMLEALTPHVRVKMLVDSDERAGFVGRLADDRNVVPDQLEFVVQPTTDVWLRDSGPLFISNGEELRLADFDWAYYGFPWPVGGPTGMARDKLDQEIAAQFRLRKRNSHVVAEGGGIDVNSRSMVSYLDAAMVRNRGLSVAEIEAEFMRLYGKDQVIWLNRAPISDRVFVGPKIANYFGWGANGHVDEYVRFVSEDTILVAQVSEEERDLNPLYRLDHEILAENMAQLRLARNANGQPFKIIPVPMPDVTALMRTRRLTEEDFDGTGPDGDMSAMYRSFSVGDEIHFLPAASYLNFLVTNNVVLVAKYANEDRAAHLADTDEAMRQILAEAYPERDIIQLDPLAINWGGGGMHCITQQEPKIRA